MFQIWQLLVRFEFVFFQVCAWRHSDTDESHVSKLTIAILPVKGHRFIDGRRAAMSMNSSWCAAQAVGSLCVSLWRWSTMALMASSSTPLSMYPQTRSCPVDLTPWIRAGFMFTLQGVNPARPKDVCTSDGLRNEGTIPCFPCASRAAWVNELTLHAV